MKKILRYVLIGIGVILVLYAVARVLKTNSKPAVTFDTATATEETITNRVVATGKVIPEDEVLIKPQISGIIESILVEEGDKLKSGDLIANSIGSALCISQALYWNEQKILLKYSYRPSQWAEQNPKQLGKNHLQRALKDYNGQTYWLSFNMKSLLLMMDLQIILLK